MTNMEFLADLGLAVLLSALEAVVLVGFWFVEGMKQWAARGQSVPDPTGRYVLALSTGSTCSAVIAYGLNWADLPITAARSLTIVGMAARASAERSCLISMSAKSKEARRRVGPGVCGRIAS